MPRIKAPPDAFSARVRMAMAKTTQTALQGKTRIDRSDLSGYGNGQKPDFVNMTRLCLALDVSPAWLMFGRGDRSLSALPNDPKDPAARDLIANRIAEAIGYGIDKAKEIDSGPAGIDKQSEKHRDQRNPRDSKPSTPKKR